MRTILCATDFSGAAETAAEYAASMAREFHAQLILFNSHQPVSAILPEAVILLNSNENAEMIEWQLNDVRALIDPMQDIDIEKKWMSGPIVMSIIKEVETSGADLLICGLKERGLGIRKIFGSTITSLLHKIRIPMLIVPENSNYSRIKSMALAIDSNIFPVSNPDIPVVLTEISTHFHSKLYVVHVSQNEMKEAYELLNPPNPLVGMANSQDPVFKSISGTSVNESLLSFVKKFKIDLFVFQPRHHSLMEKLIYRSETKAMIFSTEIPLLVLPER